MTHTFGFRLAAFAAVLLAFGAGIAAAVRPIQDGAVERFQPGGFRFQVETHVPVPPARAFDLFTGDVKPWWDYTFSSDPVSLRIEPKPGGGFLEVFDAEGNGVQHAVVTAAQRGELLRFVGPLGLAGSGISMEHTLTFEPAEGGTRVAIAVVASGYVDPAWPESVRGVWKHFLVERYTPYVSERAREAR